MTADLHPVSVPIGAVVPAARRTSVFESHRRTLLPTALMFHTAAIGLPFLMAAPGLALGSLAMAAVGSVAGLAVTLSMLSRGALIGNARLERRLRAKLTGSARRLEFVGICELANNTLERRIRRFETDDNVGLLAVTDRKLVVFTEEGKIEIPRETISAVSLEPLPDYPRLSWVRIEFDADLHGDGVYGDRHGFLLMSRDARKLDQIRTQTEALYRRVVDWHADSQLAWLERARRT